MESKDTERRIIHVDMDAFYASVEQLDNPQLRGKAVAVGGSRKRGVVMAASYEARKFGVYSAMPSITAKRKCPDLIFARPRFERYREFSAQIRRIFYEYTEKVEPLSLDEAYLDVTENRRGHSSAAEVAREIKRKIMEQTHLTASAGVSTNKFLAKMASGFNKPDGLTIIPPSKADKFIEGLPIEKFFGVGQVTAGKMKKLGVFNGKDLKKLSELELSRNFGKNGKYFYKIVRGIDNREVEANRMRKSLSAELTYTEDLISRSEIEKALYKLSEILEERIHKYSAYGKTLSLKLKYADFVQICRSVTLDVRIETLEVINESALLLFERIGPLNQGVRLLGLGVSNFSPPLIPDNQLKLKL